MAFYNWSIPVNSFLVKVQKAGGFILGVNDGEEYIKMPNSEDKSALAIRKEATECVTSVDAAVVYIEIPGGVKGTIFIVLGNEPEELISDYSCSLEDFLEPVCEKYEQEWEGKKCPMIND